MSSFLPDLTTKIHPLPPSPIDLFDLLPDPLLLLIFNSISDVKTLGRCSLLSKRFHSLIPQVQNVIIHVDCVISDDPTSSTSSCSDIKPRFSSFFKLLFNSLSKPVLALSQFLSSKRILSLSGGSSSFSVGNTSVGNDLVGNTSVGNTSVGNTSVGNDLVGNTSVGNTSVGNTSVGNTSVGNTCVGDDVEQSGVTHHSLTQVLKNFNDIKSLKIELPSGELGIDDDVVLKWRAEFGSTLDNCVMLGASSVVNRLSESENGRENNRVGDDNDNGNGNDNGSIPESFYTNGGLKLRVVWTISSLIAASARHYLLQQIISEHKTLESLVLTDVDRQGVLCMNKEQLEELRVKPLSASSASKRTLVPALNMKLWYAPYLELPNGSVLKGATLVAIRPSEQAGQKEVSDGSWVASAFEEPYGTAARMLVKRRTYCLEMNSF